MDSAISIPTQVWLLYQMRFLIAPDLAGDWAAFGGISAQLNHLDILMNISITDSASVALPYGRLARGFLSERERSRREVSGVNSFGDCLSVENPDLELRAAAEHPSRYGPSQGCPDGTTQGQQGTGPAGCT